MLIEDKEFGEVIVRKSALSKNVKFSVSTSGRLQMSVPKYTSAFLAKRFLNANRPEIRNKLPLKDYLPYRLEYFAKLYNYHYARIRFSHANTRWGSCSSNGTISLNIGLMNLPEKLRDYVLIHELAHLNHMDHSKAFWAEVASHDKNYRDHRRRLKNYSPGV